MSRDIQEAVFFTINVLKLFVSLFFLSVTNKNLFEIPEAGFFFNQTGYSSFCFGAVDGP